MCTSVLGRLRDLQYTFAVIYKTLMYTMDFRSLPHSIIAFVLPYSFIPLNSLQKEKQDYAHLKLLVTFVFRIRTNVNNASLNQ